MNIKQALKLAIKKINSLDAEVLLSSIIKKNKAFLYTHPEYILNNNKINKFKKYISRRSKNEPVAYIVGNKNFFNLNFLVNKNVLIPRPETEILVEEALKIIKNPVKSLRSHGVITILEIGTGSGCIIISLAKNINPSASSGQAKKMKFYATDISKKILNIAEKNAKINNIKNNITFIKSDLLKNINPVKSQSSHGASNLKNSILIANLPYLPNNFKNKFNLKYEPKQALYAGKDGLDLYRKLFLEIKNLKYKPECILCEFGDNQTEKITKITKNILPEYKIKIKKDLAGLDRLVILTLKSRRTLQCNVPTKNSKK